MNNYTKADILKIANEKEVRFVRLQFTDILGSIKNVAISASQLEKALDNQCMFDGSSIEGFVRIEESDMKLHPDYNSFALFPWRENNSVARLICDVYKPDGTPFHGSPRQVLKNVLDEAKELILKNKAACSFIKENKINIDENLIPLFSYVTKSSKCASF